KGGRPARNFDPRYAKKTPFHDRQRPGDERGKRSDAAERPARDTRPGSKSPSHRGYRLASSEQSGQGAPKQRWSAQERAGRDESRGIRNRAESGRRESPHHRQERPVRGGDERRPFVREERAE